MARPALDHAARITAPPVPVTPPPWPVYGVYGYGYQATPYPAYNPYRS